jgi:hypothetical protein
MTASATARKREPEVPEPVAVVRWFPNPINVIRAYVESDFAQALATELARKVKVLSEEGVAVDDAISLQRVEERLVDVAGHRKEIEGWFKPIKDFAFRLHRMICDRETEILRPLRLFESAAKDSSQAYRREQERIRQAEEQRLQAEARRAEQERLTREAEFLEQRGESDLAEQVLEQAIAAPAPVVVVADNLPRTAGISHRERWCWRPIGGDTPQNRVRALKLVPREFLCLDEKKLNAHARAHGASARVPGIEFWDAGSVSVRT